MPNLSHKLYLDDSGNKEYDPKGDYTKGGRTPYFVFGGLLARPEVAGSLSASMEKLKTAAFGTPEVEIKANWLRREDERKARYLDRFGIDAARLKRFVDDVYGVINGHECELVACVVNKAEVQQMYRPDRVWYAPAIAYECVIQRVQHSMEACDGYAHVTIDDMDGKSPKGRDWKENLKRHHGVLRTRGSQLRRGMVLDRILGDEPAFRDSAHDERLQLADLVSYAVYKQFLDHGADWEVKQNELPTYEYFKLIGEKFRNRDRQVQGFGVVKFPLKKRVRWQVTK